MDAPQNIEMATRGETPFDVKASATQEAVAKVMNQKVKMVAPDMLEMEPHYVNDFIKCNPFDENACMVNPKYDAYALCNGRYLSEGCHLAAPSQEGMHQKAATEVPVTELKPICAEGCDMTSLYLDFPACIGGSWKCTFLCCMQRGSMIKCIDSMAQDEDKRCLAICEEQSYLVIPKTLCYCQSQYFCCDYRGALPCTNEMPCMLNVGGFNIMADWKVKTGCCKTVGQLVPRLGDGEEK